MAAATARRSALAASSAMTRQSKKWRGHAASSAREEEGMEWRACLAFLRQSVKAMVCLSALHRWRRPGESIIGRAKMARMPWGGSAPAIVAVHYLAEEPIVEHQQMQHLGLIWEPFDFLIS